MDTANGSALAMLALGLTGIIGIIVWMGLLTQNLQNGAEIRKTLGIVGGVSGFLIFFFAVAAYNYLSVNVNYLTPFMFILGFINLFLSLFAVSASSLQLVKA